MEMKLVAAWNFCANLCEYITPANISTNANLEMRLIRLKTHGAKIIRLQTIRKLTYGKHPHVKMSTFTVGQTNGSK